MDVAKLAHNVAYALPDGIDADVHLYFVAPSVGMECKVSIGGIQLFADAAGFETEARRIISDTNFQERAKDWRLMTADEVLDWHKRQEAGHADQDHQEKRSATTTGC